MFILLVLWFHITVIGQHNIHVLFWEVHELQINKKKQQTLPLSYNVASIIV